MKRRILSILALAAAVVLGGANADTALVDVEVRGPKGEPLPGVRVNVGGATAVTGDDGVAHLTGVAAGKQTISVAREVEFLDDNGAKQKAEVKMDVDVTIVVTTSCCPGQRFTLHVKLHIETPPPAKCVPWCGLAAIDHGPNGTQRASAGGGFTGSCQSCTITDAPMPPLAQLQCNGPHSVVDPAPNGGYTVTTTADGNTANCAITLP